MAVLTDIVRNVLVIVLVAGFMEMLLPEGNMKPLVRLCIGMFILIAVLHPVLGFFFDERAFSIDSWDYQPKQSEPVVDIKEEGTRIHQTLINQSKLAAKEKLEEQIDAVAVLVPGVEKVQSQVDVDESGKVRNLILSVRIESTEVNSGNKKTGQDRGRYGVDADYREQLANKISGLMHNFYGLEENAIKIEFEGG